MLLSRACSQRITIPRHLHAPQVHVTLKKGLPYDEWGVTALAAAMGYATKACAEFR